MAHGNDGRSRRRPPKTSAAASPAPGDSVAERAEDVHTIRVLACLLVAVGALTFSNSLSAPFLFDDQSSIIDNPFIRSLWPLSRLFLAPGNAVTTARPLVSLSLAINYALGGLDVRGYHLFNVGVHVLTALVLFGIARRSLLASRFGGSFDGVATPLGAATALLWMLHPMQTEAVNYISQRTESMMGLFYLLTLYSAIRAADGSAFAWWPWGVSSVIACVAGAASKQVIVTAPLAVALWDWTFLSEPFRQVLKKRRPLYAALCGTWIVLAALMWRFQDTNVGAGVTVLDYARAQCMVIIDYLQRAIWPTHLLLDYGLPGAVSWGDAAPYAAVLIVLLAATVVLLVRWRPLGFLAAWVFITLAPTSSIVPLATEVGAERRMYVPLAGLVALVVVLGYLLVQRLVPTSSQSQEDHAANGAGRPQWIGLALVVSIATGFCWLTVRRNGEYRNPVQLWSSAVEIKPDNWRAHNNLGIAQEAEGRQPEAIAEYQRALELNSRFGPAHYNLAKALYTQGRIDDAIAHYTVVMDAEPTAPVATDMGVALEARGQLDDARQHYLRALQIDPQYPDAHFNLGRALFAAGRVDEAISHYHEALAARPGDPRVHTVLGTALAAQRRFDDAIAEYRRALEIAPGLSAARQNLGAALVARGKIDDAIVEFRLAVGDNPEGMEARRLLARVLSSSPTKIPEATAEYERIFAFTGDARVVALAHRDYGDMLLAQKTFDDAIAQYHIAEGQLPDDPNLHFSMGVAFGLAGRAEDSISHFESAVRLAPEWPAALVQLASELVMQPRPARQDVARAVELTERAAALTNRKDVTVLRTLQLIYAAAGRADGAQAVGSEIAALEPQPPGATAGGPQR